MESHGAQARHERVCAAWTQADVGGSAYVDNQRCDAGGIDYGSLAANSSTIADRSVIPLYVVVYEVIRMTAPRPPIEPTVAIVVPIRTLAHGDRPVVRRRAGRPRRVETAPTIDEALYHDTVFRAAIGAIEQDSVVVAATTNDSVALIERAIRAVAQEAGALKYDREVAMREGRSEVAERASSRRVAALGRLGELLGIREELRQGRDELDGELVDRAIAMLVAHVESVVREVAPQEMADRFMRSLGAHMALAGSPAQWGT